MEDLRSRKNYDKFLVMLRQLSYLEDAELKERCGTNFTHIQCSAANRISLLPVEIEALIVNIDER